MGLLAPLYALAAVAIAGPIVFHLIRRQPRGQREFSSLMFLRPTPPKLTRRSRLDNWLLLLLRCLALGLIAFAFARPYFRQTSMLSSALAGRSIAILLDTSASMQRPGVWNSAQANLTEIFDALSPEDRVALYTVDRQVQTIVPLDPVAGAAANQLAARQAASQIRPSLAGTELAQGLQTVVDAMSDVAIADQLDPSAQRKVILISDLHLECGLESLQGFPWPESIGLDVRRVSPSQTGNARPSLMGDLDEDSSSPESIRVRIENNTNSPEQALELSWANKNGTVGSTTTRVQVPAGQVRIVPMQSQPPAADRVQLSGDAWPGDNMVYLPSTEPQIQKVAFCGNRPKNNEEDLAYFLRQAPLSTRWVNRDVEVFEATRLAETINKDASLKTLVFEITPTNVELATDIRAFAESGGNVLVVLGTRPSKANLQTQFLRQLLDSPGLRVTEAAFKDFALVGMIDYRHPIFSPFADPRFNDFSKIRFWSHRNLEWQQDGNDTATKVIARYDNQAPWIVQKRIGAGNVWILTCGWQPSASRLALSSKFIPIVMGLLDPDGAIKRSQPSYEVGEKIPIESVVRVVDDVGNVLDSEQASLNARFVRIHRPGLFNVELEESTMQLAVHLPLSESRLDPMDADVFEQYGIVLNAVESDQARRESARQMRIEELEKQQRFWQWMIAMGIVVLAAETLLGGWAARRVPAEAPA